ncbi:tRNA 2-selenouridine(34) synthase MnmH [Mongoliitalea daihaiensis]|uniref:tRNA 2-selenouridine(34) synthase MnmH n=1 Tax=Mongoliitalea daihaiensis TaxID=2782006 RepID=UPI001F19892B|nr:tRNA 2-selenouridine(34) synthase MnmH [Mongoliitalea daihaiensis]UJP65362.1 tRNA 2-selenouridine(34) synthase MnmH [Mongoliitalea daihaiensis]
MTEQLVSLEQFLALRATLPLIDARSEGEFAQAHIVGAYNLPILNDEERKLVGTIYKQKSSEAAVLKGFELVGPRFADIMKEAMQICPKKKVLLYCWRGGMRSQILSWLLSMVGFQVFRLEGGYKNYRTATFESVRKPLLLLVLGGRTGVGKTVLLQKLKNQGEAILDLEGLAHHKGSAFGGIGQLSQPSNEYFENLLAEEIWGLPADKPIWVENESRKIGTVILPDVFFTQLQSAPMIEIIQSREQRIKHIAAEYASLPRADLQAAIKKLSKKLGGLRTQLALEALEEGLHARWIDEILSYYDKFYDYDLENNHANILKSLDFTDVKWDEGVQILLKTKNELTWKKK